MSDNGNDPHDSKRSAAKRQAIVASGLTKTYELGSETIEALAGVDFTVDAGEFVAVMGPSGSGKSTLLHLIGLLDTPDEGSVSIGGAPTADLTDDALTAMRRNELGFIFQNFELIPNLSAEENILLPAEVSGPERYASARSRLRGLTERLGIADRLAHRPRQLSGGQRQRVALARALINEPTVVLADEPTGNLDSKTGAEVLGLLRSGVDDEGWTVVMVTHDRTAALTADRIVFLRDGSVVGQTLTSDASAAADVDDFLAS